MAYFPIFTDLNDRLVCIIGSGPVAWRKARSMMDCGARIRMISPAPSAEERISDLEYRQKRFEPQDLDGAFLVIAASGDPETNLEVSACAREHSILCNVVDDAESSSFIFGSVLLNGPLRIGISTSGASPSAARWLKDSIQEQIPDWMENVLDFLLALRPSIKESVPDEKVRARIFHSLFEACVQQQGILSPEQIQDILEAGSCLK